MEAHILRLGGAAGGGAPQAGHSACHIGQRSPLLAGHQGQQAQEGSKREPAGEGEGVQKQTV